MNYDQPTLFIDLHGVLINTPRVFDEYKQITVNHLKKCFNLTQRESERRYDRAMDLWQTKAFGYLKDPRNKKTGDQLVNFFEHCDKIFPKTLYEGLSISVDLSKLRTRPFEYKIAKKIKSLYPESLNTLKTLKKQNYRMYIASSSHSSHIKGLIKANELHNFIIDAFGFDDLLATKHTLSYYKNLLDKTNINPNFSFMIGNSIQEVLNPRKIGMKTIHINRERTIPAEIQKLADRSLNNLRSLPIHLNKIPGSV